MPIYVLQINSKIQKNYGLRVTKEPIGNISRSAEAELRRMEKKKGIACFLCTALLYFGLINKDDNPLALVLLYWAVALACGYQGVRKLAGGFATARTERDILTTSYAFEESDVIGTIPDALIESAFSKNKFENMPAAYAIFDIEKIVKKPAQEVATELYASNLSGGTAKEHQFVLNHNRTMLDKPTIVFLVSNDSRAELSRLLQTKPLKLHTKITDAVEAHLAGTKPVAHVSRLKFKRH